MQNIKNDLNISMIETAYNPNEYLQFSSQIAVPKFLIYVVEKNNRDMDGLPLAIVRNEKDVFFLVENNKENINKLVVEHVFRMIHHLNHKDLLYNICRVWYKDNKKLDISSRFVEGVRGFMPNFWAKFNQNRTKKYFFDNSIAFFFCKNVSKNKKDDPDAYIIHLMTKSEIPLIKPKLSKDVCPDSSLVVYPSMFTKNADNG